MRAMLLLLLLFAYTTNSPVFNTWICVCGYHTIPNIRRSTDGCFVARCGWRVGETPMRLRILNIIIVSLS